MEGHYLFLLIEGRCRKEVGDFAAAEQCYLRGLEALRRAGDRITEGTFLNNLGVLHEEMGCYEQAEAELQESLNAMKRAGLPEQFPTFTGTQVGLQRVRVTRECLRLFGREEYLSCMEKEAELGGSGTSYALHILSAVCRQRLTRTMKDAEDELAKQGTKADDAWEGLLARLATGHARIDEVINRAGNDLQRCQAHAYAGVRLRTEGQADGALTQFAASLAFGIRCHEAYLAELERDAIDTKRRFISLFQAAMDLKQQGRVDQALTAFSEAWDFLKRREYYHPILGYMILKQLLLFQKENGDYQGALQTSEELLVYARTNLHPADLMRHTAIDDCAHFREALDDYPGAEALLKEALAFISESVERANEARDLGLGSDPLIAKSVSYDREHKLAGTLNSLGLLYHRMGRYAEARHHFERSIAVLRQVSSPERQESLASSLNNLACLLDEMGNPEAARALFEESLDLLGATTHEEDPRYVATLNSLVGSLMNLGAEPDPDLMRRWFALARRAIDSLEVEALVAGLGVAAPSESRSGNGPAGPRMSDPAWANLLQNMALMYRSKGEAATAETCARQALLIRKRAFGERSRQYAMGLSNLALHYLHARHLESAELLARQALALLRDVLGEDHPDVAAILDGLASIAVAQGRPAVALEFMASACTVEDNAIDLVFSASSEAERMNYLRGVGDSLDRHLCLVARHFAADSAAIRSALDRVLRRKALLAEASAVRRDAVLGGRHPELGAGLRELDALRTRLARKTLEGPGPEGPDIHRQLLEEWGRQRDRLEAELARLVPEFDLRRRLRAAGRSAVAAALPPESVLVELVRYRPFDLGADDFAWRSARYLAFVLHAGEADDVRMIDLGEAEPTDRLISAFRAAITGESEGQTGRDLSPSHTAAEPPIVTETGEALRSALFDPLVPTLAGRSRLFLAVDGDLTRLPWEVLPLDGDHRLIDGYRIVYLATGRDVLRLVTTASENASEPLIIADPAFDLGSEVDVPATSGPADAPRRRAEFWARLFRRRKSGGVTAAAVDRSPPTDRQLVSGRRSRDLDRAKYSFPRLPGTRAEGERISAALGVTPWLDATALEGCLKEKCHSPRILHFATHGFFLQDQQSRPGRPGRDFTGFGGPDGAFNRFQGPLPENPLLRSGLALSGANTWLKGDVPPAEAEDGLLTAEDVTGLDLLGTELVVLSACETGLGEVRTGEGVFGLRRSFVLAGARTLVMSLWKVPDQPTQELMVNFYRRILAGQGCSDALRDTQLALRIKYPDPYYWGAFICQGDLGPLRPPES
jgi:tetratricopeptide (TPR) repeat protein